MCVCVCSPGLCGASSELGCVTVSSSSLPGGVVTAVVHPIAPPTPATHVRSSDDAPVNKSTSLDLVDIAPMSQHRDGSSDMVGSAAVSSCVYLYYWLVVVTSARAPSDVSPGVCHLSQKTPLCGDEVISTVPRWKRVFAYLSFRAPCGLRGCKNRPAPFPGQMSYKATKPGLVSVLYLSMRYMVLLFIRAPFYVLLVFIAMCSVFLFVLVKLSVLAK